MSKRDETLAYASFRHGDHAAAIVAFDRALARDPTRSDLLLDRGICAEIIEGSESAISCFDRALALQPDSVKAWYNNGVSLMRLERYEEAVAAFDKAVKIHRRSALLPDHDILHALYNMGSCQMLLGRHEDALDSLDDVVGLARDEPDDWREEARRAEELKHRLFSLYR